MVIYQLHYRDEMGESGGYSYHATKRDALRLKSESVANGGTVELERIETPVTRESVIDLLNQYAGHPDNG